MVCSKSFGTFEIARQLNVLVMLGKHNDMLPIYHPAVLSYHPRAICSLACRVCLAIIKMADIHKQHVNIAFCFKLGKTFTEPHEMMKNIYGDQCMSRTDCHEEFKRFKDGQQPTHDKPRFETALNVM
jgi:hypothetical protein